MQNIDLLYALQPIIVIVICSTLMIYWYFKRHFRASVWAYSAIAYIVAIALKYAVQLPTLNIVIANFGAHSIMLGLYYGLQTVGFEVGLAYLVAWYAVSHGKLEKKDAEAYGSGLAFWENAIYLGALSLLSIFGIYSVLATNSAATQTDYSQLMTNQPGLFAPAAQALGSVALGTVERISSILIHFSFGYLCVMAAVYNKKWLFLIALPLGFVDFLVPFSAPSNVNLFEGVVFVWAVLSVVVAWFAVRQIKKNSEKPNILTQN